MNKLLAIGVFLCAGSVQATDLNAVYRDARASDPTFQEAYATYLSSKEALPQARAGLLPSVDMTATLARTRYAVTGNTSYASKDWYNNQTYELTVTQAIFDYEAWMEVRQANKKVKEAVATLRAAYQDLIVRTAKAYLDVLHAQDDLSFTRSEKRANFRQLEQAKARYQVGVATRLAVYQAQAGYDAVSAEEISARNNVSNQFERLRSITGRHYTHLAPLSSKRIPFVWPNPRKVEVWVQRALKQNYSLQAKHFAALSARDNIKVQDAARYPTVSLEGDYEPTIGTLASSSTGVFVNTNTADVELNVSFPIFQGGLVISETRQARYDYEAAMDAWTATYRSTVANTRIAYSIIIDSISKIRADRLAVTSARNSVKDTEAQFKVGTSTMLDVLNTQKALYEAQENLATAQYAYMNSLLALKELAGTLSPQDLMVLNRWLTTGHRHHAVGKAKRRHRTKHTY